VFRIAVYGFLAIISMITVLNIMNSISMSVSARIKQYGAMRAVGMGKSQLTKMIAAEAGTYALSGMVVGIVFGLVLHYCIYEKMIISHFGGRWQIPVASVGCVVLLVLVSCVVAVYAPSKRICGMEITETINEL
jgi:putative ABC transport system permease protein